MWYFSWVLGLGLACTFAILNAMWLELDPKYAASPSGLPADDDEAASGAEK
ncbi:MAG: cytochrome bd-I oxidase subunit CydX [Proteobacteria bacterium]|nr:cytochrome bd-I oxidase subunit CydX [Pseudomonadota bacterium]